jgi:hypothetical protein
MKRVWKHGEGTADGQCYGTLASSATNILFSCNTESTTWNECLEPVENGVEDAG